MASKTLQSKVQAPFDTAANWQNSTRVLLYGEKVYAKTSGGAIRSKTGDGTKTFSQLPYDDEALYESLSKYVVTEDGATLEFDSSFGDGPHTLEIDTDPIPATEISFNGALANMTSTNVQNAIVELSAMQGGGGGGASNTIKITFDSDFVGSTYTVTDGASDTRTGTVPAGGTVSIAAVAANTTYTVSCVVDDVTYSNTVTTGQYYGEYTVTLSGFTATINVTTAPGAAVSATTGGTTYSATTNEEGLAAVLVKRSGSYTVTATKNNASSNSATVTVNTDGATVSTSVSFIVLELTSPDGSAVTVQNNDTTLTATSTGVDTFYLPNTGTWEVSVEKDGATATGSVDASDYQTYRLNVGFTNIYGVTWDGSSSTVLSRTDAAESFVNPVPATSASGSGSSPFDTLMPWAGIVKEEDSEAGTLVKIPKFWYKITKNGSAISIQIADGAVDGFSVSPAHMNRGDGSGERDYVYVGRYHSATSTYKSATGVKPQVSITRSAARTSIHNLGTTIWQMDFAMRLTIQLLYIVEFANWDSQATIGGGCSQTTSSSSAVFNMGATDGMVYHTGNVQGSHSAYGACQYRWIEGLWDNCYDWMDGCYYSSSGMSIVLKPANFSDTANGTVIGTPTSGYPSALGVSTAVYPMFYPTASSGSNTTYIPDYWDFNASSPCLRCGGYYYQNLNHGLFYVNYNGTAGTGGSIGCRLQKLP